MLLSLWDVQLVKSPVRIVNLGVQVHLILRLLSLFDHPFSLHFFFQLTFLSESKLILLLFFLIVKVFDLELVVEVASVG
jgi:hypothetical protein